MKLVACSIALFSLIACSSDPAPTAPPGDDDGTKTSGPWVAPNSDVDTTQPASVSDVQSYCDSKCSKMLFCTSVENTNCSSDCVRGSSKTVDNFRTDYYPTITKCVDAAKCPADKNAFATTLVAGCMEDFGSVDPAYPDIGEVQSCLTMRHICKSTFNADLCNSITVLNDGARKKANECVTGDCDAIESCLHDLGI